jgi:peptidoglycan-associated lipoprotein
MKMIKLIYPMTLALSVALAGTGCHHSPVKTTQLPGSPEAPVVDQQNPPTLPPPSLPSAPPITPDQNPQVTTPPYTSGPIAENSEWDPKTMVEDRDALAASTVHFEFDSAVVKTSEQENIQAVATYLTSNPNDKLMIEGNCDERGTEEYNRSLGERRALALREALAKLNVDSKRVRTISYGKDKPADPGHDEAAWAKNRRGDFVVYHPKAGV